MALGATNITTGAVRNEISVASNSVSVLVGATGLNKYSLYAPGTIGPNVNKDLILTPPTTNYKLGDFRLYNHSALAPNWIDPPSGFLYWGPGGGVANATIAMEMNTLNLASSTVASEIIDSTTTPWHYHVRVDVYDHPDIGTNNRATGTPIKSWILGIRMNSVESGFTVLSGHTRNMSGKAIMNTGASGFIDNATGILAVLNDVAVSGTCTRYFEIYFCDIAGNRKLNFGTRGVGYPGYQDIEFRESQQPKIYTGYAFNIVGQSNPPDIGGFGWTYAAPQINDTNAVCTVTTPLNMTQGSANVQFYVKVKGISNGTNYTYGVSSADILLDYGPNGNDYTDTYFTGTSWVANSGGKQINTVLGGGRTWQYNWTGRVRLANTVFSSGDYQSCP